MVRFRERWLMMCRRLEVPPSTALMLTIGVIILTGDAVLIALQFIKR